MSKLCVAVLLGGLLASPISSAAPSTRPTTRPTTRPVMPYLTAHDKPLDVKEQVIAQEADHTLDRVEFNGIRQERVPAYLYIPRSDQPNPAKRPAVLLQYGSGGSKKSNYIVALGKLFVSRGFVVITIDIPNKGERRKDRRTNIFDGRFAETLGDYSRTVDYLLTRDDVDPQRIGYVGISWGAITGITYAAHDPRVKVMASVVGGGNFLGWLPGEIEPAILESVKSFDPVYHIPHIAPRPLLLLNVTHDLLVPRFMSESLHKAAGDTPSTRKIWLDTDHIFSTVNRTEVATSVVDFVQQSFRDLDKKQ